MFSFDAPQLLLLLIPVLLAYRQYASAAGFTGWLRITLLTLLILALAQPGWRWFGEGTDLWVLADRSSSLSQASQEQYKEIIRSLERQRGSGDRLGILSFGLQPRLESHLSEQSQFGEFQQTILAEGSDLSGAIQRALELSHPQRPTRLFLLTDGEATTQDPARMAQQAQELQIPLDYRLFERLRYGDAAITRLNVPEEITQGQPFVVAVDLQSEAATPATVTLYRDGKIIARKGHNLVRGPGRILFRDRLDDQLKAEYKAVLKLTGDPIPENNTALLSTVVQQPQQVLLISETRTPGWIANTLEQADVKVRIIRPQDYSGELAILQQFRTVILENVPASRLGRRKLMALKDYVESLGGGLLMTGGRSSFGSGGYFNSPLDETLPVSMELRTEHRKLQLALSVVLDRSGSMGVPVTETQTKMDLANLATAECLRLLSPGDSASVIAVDTEPVNIIPQLEVEEPELLAQKAMRINVGGGGIFVEQALEAAFAQVTSAPQQTRHVILFADATDAEKPGEYRTLLKKYCSQDVTVSVIGLGTELDPDAGLLKEVAELGGGNIMFTENPAELPRLFSEETMNITRSTFVEAIPEEQPAGIPGAVTANYQLLAEPLETEFPGADGYNLTYMRPGAKVGIVSEDEYEAPFCATWNVGQGRSAAITWELDGQTTGRMKQWDEAGRVLNAHVQWLLGSEQDSRYFASTSVVEQQGVITVELDPEAHRQGEIDQPVIEVLTPNRQGQALQVTDIQWTGPHTLEAKFPLSGIGSYLTTLRFPDQDVVAGPRLSLSYSPEFAITKGAGPKKLQQMAIMTGGKRRTDLTQLFGGTHREEVKTSLVPWLLSVACVVFLMEIAGRRLQLWSRKQQNEFADEKSQSQPYVWKKKKSSKPVPTNSPQPATEQKETAATDNSMKPPEPAAPADIFRQAKQRARKRK